MGSIRPLTAEDGPRLAEVHLSAFGHFGNTEEEVRRAYSRSNLAMLFEHRYRAHATPSLAFEVDGIVVGYVLTMCRPAVFSGKRVWIATTSHLAVDPQFRSSLAAIHLLREVTNGPQDLTYIDRSNSAGRKSEMAAGFEPLPAYSLGWTRLMRPGHITSARVARATSIPVLGKAGLLLEAAVPSKLRNRLIPELPDRAPAISSGELTIDHVTETGISLLPSVDLHPILDDPDHVRHEWDLLARAHRNARVVRKVLLSKRGDVVGWYIFTVDPGKRADVIQFVAKRSVQRMAIIHLLQDISETDAVEASGRLPYWLLYDIEDLGCAITTSDVGTAVHSLDPDILAAFAQNRAWLSEFEGEAMISLVTAVPR